MSAILASRERMSGGGEVASDGCHAQRLEKLIAFLSSRKTTDSVALLHGFLSHDLANKACCTSDEDSFGHSECLI